MVSPQQVPPYGRPLHAATLVLRDLMLSRAELERAHAARLNVNAVDYRAMGALIGQGPVSPGWLAEELGLTPSATSNVIERLVAVGHAERHRDPDDGRRMVVSAVPESRARALSGVRPIIERAEQAINALPDDQQRAVVTYLSDVTDALRTVLSTLTDEKDPDAEN